jgi:DNA-binding NtrC family response regulator
MEGAKLFKVLVVDDDADLRELLTEAVAGWGYAVSMASSGDEAVQKIYAERFDIVITDLMMPGMDGLELLERINRLDREIVVIMVTGNATMETAVKAIEAGAYDYIAKPFRLDDLMVLVKNAAERLGLIHRNTALNDELTRAYSEIEHLKQELKSGASAAASSGLDA